MSITQTFPHVVIGATEVSVWFAYKNNYPIIFKRIFPPNTIFYNQEKTLDLLSYLSVSNQVIHCDEGNSIRIDSDNKTIKCGTDLEARILNYETVHIFDSYGLVVDYEICGEVENNHRYWEFSIDLSNRVKLPPVAMGSKFRGIQGDYFAYYSQKKFNQKIFFRHDLKRQEYTLVEKYPGIFKFQNKIIELYFYNSDIRELLHKNKLAKTFKGKVLKFRSKLKQWNRIMVYSRAETEEDMVQLRIDIASIFALRYDVGVYAIQDFEGSGEKLFSLDSLQFLKSKQNEGIKTYATL
jgi:hypothetical protein